MKRARVAIHKFSSCDGCQLAFLNLGESLLELTRFVDILHFAEAGPVAPEAKVDIAFVEGSISTSEDIERIRQIREQSGFLVTIGACATAGGIQALRNMANTREWIEGIYANPSVIDSLDDSTAIRDHVDVDLELWGCPVSKQQVLMAIRSLLFKVLPREDNDKVCLECKRKQNVCVMVTRDEPCMGPVTRSGCGALCPHVGRDCYGCYGPAENTNTRSLANRLHGFGLVNEQIAQRFLFINSGATSFKREGKHWKDSYE